jgi:biotin synthase
MSIARQTCTTHSYEDRINTIKFLKNAGIKICSGGIIGMGETREDRIDLALEVRAIDANVVPVNILNPIPGTPLEKQEQLPPMEILKTIALFRFILPQKEVMIAGGRTVNLRDMQSMIFTAGASALMVGNYLTTLNQPVEKDLQMLKDLGLDPDWDNDFADQISSSTKCESSWNSRRQRLHLCGRAAPHHDQPRREADRRVGRRDDPRGRH